MLITRSLLVLEVWFGPLVQGQTRISKLKSVKNSLIIGHRGLGWKTNLWEIMGWESSGVVGFDLRPPLQGQTRIPNLKVLITCSLLVLEVCDGNPIYRKSWAGNLVVSSDFILGPSFKVKGG